MFFSSIAKQYGVNVVAGIIEKGKKFFNTLLFINREGELADNTGKIHPFTMGEEAKHYTAVLVYINNATEDFHMRFFNLLRSSFS
ncbi:MAG: hypothetical protein IPG53_06275 [Ignavibacteriales bacterium]|nr:hypothetical protein [Ignavibacteriales bacterium]